MTGSISLAQNPKNIVCETDLTKENPQQLTLETQSEDLYELLHDAPDNYFPQESTHPRIDSTSEIHHTSKIRHNKNFLQ